MHEKYIVGGSHIEAEEPGRVVRNNRNASIRILVIGVFLILLAQFLFWGRPSAGSSEIRLGFDSPDMNLTPSGMISLDSTQNDKSSGEQQVDLQTSVGAFANSPENLTLQNQKIFCWGRSYAMGVGVESSYETYPDHLGRLLGREVDHSLLSWMGFMNSNRAVDDVSYFDENKYGIVIMRTRFDGTGVTWDVTENNLRSLVRRLKDTGAVVVMLETAPLWDLDGQLTSTADRCYVGTSAEMGVCGTYIICTSVDGETQTEKYYELWGDTVFKKMAEEEGAFFIPESVFDCIEEGEDTCPPFTNIHTDLMSGEGAHPNDMGYGVLAERVAEYLVDWGLAEYAESYEEMSESLSTMMSATEAHFIAVEERGVNATELRDDFEYDLVQYLAEKGFTYTAKRFCNKLFTRLDGALTGWAEMSELFDNASMHIDAAAQAGMDTASMQNDYRYAEIAWNKLDSGVTRWWLDRILSKKIIPAPESSLLPLLSIFMLPIWRRLTSSHRVLHCESYEANPRDT
jgi:hypothetical protein